MPCQRAETGRRRGTKRSASSATEGHGENTNAPQRAPKRRVQAEFLAPEDVRLRVTQDSLDLRIERTDREDGDDTRSSSWIATTRNRGVVGHGSTDLIRRQLDQIDALAPYTMLEFVIHPVHERIILAQPPDDRDEREVGVAQDPVPPINGSPKTPLPRVPSPDQVVPPPLPCHSPGFSEKPWSPEYPPWLQSWDHLPAEAKRKWEARCQETPEPSNPRQSNHRYPTRFSKRDDTPRLIVTIKRVPAQAELAPGLQTAATEEEEHEDNERRAQESNNPRTRPHRTCTRRGMFKAQPVAEEPQELDQRDYDPCDSRLVLQEEDEAQDDQSHDTDEPNDDGNSGSSDDSSSTDISADSTDDSSDTENAAASGCDQQQYKRRENPVLRGSVFRSRARINHTRYPRRQRKLTRRSPDRLWF